MRRSRRRPSIRQRSVDELGRHDHGRHARYARRLPGRDPRPDDGPVGLDDCERAERLPAGALRAEGLVLSHRAVLLPPDVRNLGRAHPRPVGGARLQRRLLGRDRPLRVLREGHRAELRWRERQRSDGPDGDEAPCFTASESLLVPIGGCIGTDTDFDGPSYQPGSWPGTNSTTPTSTPIVFTSPLFNGAPELQLVSRSRPTCRGSRQLTSAAIATGRPALAASIRHRARTSIRSTRRARWPVKCVWQFGGPSIPGTTNTFGGTSTAEYGPLLQLNYPQPTPAGFVARYNNFRNTLNSNPCPG